MRLGLRHFVPLVVLLSAAPATAVAQDVGYFIGAAAGLATLSSDPSSAVTADGFALWNYTPDSGPALNLFVGAHLREYVSVQANYIWNDNDILLFTADGDRSGSRFFAQPRASSQHALVGDVLVYFRERASRIRPYLSAGLGVVRLKTTGRGGAVDGGLPAPAANAISTDATLRVAVGVDVAVGGRVRARYSFSESIGPNPISRHLDSPGARALMNFQNLVGLTLEL